MATTVWAQVPMVDPVPVAELDQIKVLIEKKKYPEAIDRLKIWQATGADQFQSGLLLSKVYVYSGDRERALDVLHKLKNLETGKRKSEIDQQIDIISKLFITNKTFQIYRDGVDLMITGRPRLAQDRFRTALEVEKNNVLIWLRLGQAWVLEGGYDPGRKALENALKIHPADSLALAWLGRASFLAGKFVQAEQELSESFRISPDLEEAVCWLSEVWSVLGKKNKAIDLLRKYTERHSFRLMAHTTLIRFEFADAEENLDRLVTLRKQIQIVVSRMTSRDESDLFRYGGEQGIGFKKIDELKKELFVLLERIDAKLAASKTE